MKKSFIFGFVLVLISGWVVLSACPSEYNHRANNVCYKGYIPSCKDMHKGVKKNVLQGSDICEKNGQLVSRPTCTQGGTKKTDYLIGVTGLPPHVNPNEDHCIKDEKTISCPSVQQPVIGPKGYIINCKLSKIQEFKCPAGLNFVKLKGNDISGFACKNNTQVKAPKCPDNFTLGYTNNTPYCSGELILKPLYK